MKRIIFFFILPAIFVMLVRLTSQSVQATSHPTVSLSDAIYADLAVNHYLDNVSIYFTNEKPSDDIRINETRHWLPASTVKLFAAMYAYKLVDTKAISLTDTVTISDKNEVPTELVTDDLPTLLTGDTITIQRLIRQMIIQSDNTAYNQLLDILGRDSITKYMQSLGLVHTHVGSKLNLDESQTQYEYDVAGYGINVTTAEDFAKAFSLIKHNKIPGAKNLYAILKDQRINSMIPFYLPKDVVCAHKTGDLAPIYHDGGICQDSKNSYIITIFTNAGDPNLLAHLSEIIYTKNFNLVGQNPDKPAVSRNIAHPVDPLVMTTPNRYILGATANNFPVPDITAADLGVKASDLSLTIADKNLPHPLIPADSPLHGLSDAWQLAKILVAPDAAARRNINLEIAKLRLAEAKDLIKRGKTHEAEALIDSMQSGLQTVAQDPTVKDDPVAQNTLQAISETRFSTLNTSLQNTKGDEKLQVIKQIANEAKQTIQQVQPLLPEAANATNPSQKALAAVVISSTATTATVKTGGGQIITVPLNSPAVIIKEATSETSATNIITPTPALTSSDTIATNPGSLSSPTIGLTVGTTVALIGTNRNNVFAPSLIIPNVPRELVAPQPVVVAKVTKDHLVVEENGIYTQVNVNPNTIVRAADTTIPLNQIKSGDIVVVHGDPLTPVVKPTTSPTPVVLPTNTTESLVTPTKLPTISQNTRSTTPVQPTSFISPTIFTTPPLILHPSSTSKITIAPTVIPSGTKTTNTTAPTSTPTQPSSPTTPPITPKVINSTSIQVIEQHQNISLPLPSQPVNHTTPVPATSHNSPPPPATQPPQQPAAPQPTATKK